MILSLGTHRSQRRLSPIEVAEALDSALKKGATFAQIAEFVNFDSTSTLREIHRLLKLTQQVRQLVGWGKPSPSTLPMKSASYVARLDIESDQISAAEATLVHGLTSEESRQLVETKIHSQRPIEECIEVVLQLRTRVDRKYLFLGAITSDEVWGSLKNMTQAERDEFLVNALENCFGRWPKWSGKLGYSTFAILGDNDLTEIMKSLPFGFEAAINSCLESL